MSRREIYRQYISQLATKSQKLLLGLWSRDEQKNENKNKKKNRKGMIAGVWCRWHTARNRAPEKQRDHHSGVGFRYFEREYKNNNIQIHGCARRVFARAVIILYTVRFYYIHAHVCVWQFFFPSYFVVRIYTV